MKSIFFLNSILFFFPKFFFFSFKLFKFFFFSPFMLILPLEHGVQHEVFLVFRHKWSFVVSTCFQSTLCCQNLQNRILNVAQKLFRNDLAKYFCWLCCLLRRLFLFCVWRNLRQMMVISVIFNLFNNSYCVIGRLSRTVEPYQPSLCSVSSLTSIFRYFSTNLSSFLFFGFQIGRWHWTN